MGCVIPAAHCVAVAVERKVRGRGLAHDGTAGVKDSRDDRGIDIWHETFKHARAVHHWHACDADRVLDGYLFAGERTAGGPPDLRLAVPGIVRVFCRTRPIAWSSRILYRQFWFRILIQPVEGGRQVPEIPFVFDGVIRSE